MMMICTCIEWCSTTLLVSQFKQQVLSKVYKVFIQKGIYLFYCPLTWCAHTTIDAEISWHSHCWPHDLSPITPNLSWPLGCQNLEVAPLHIGLLYSSSTERQRLMILHLSLVDIIIVILPVRWVSCPLSLFLNIRLMNFGALTYYMVSSLVYSLYRLLDIWPNALPRPCHTSQPLIFVLPL